MLQTPEAAEIAEQTRRRRAAVLLQRWWRRRRFQIAAERERAAAAEGAPAERSHSWLCAPPVDPEDVPLSAVLSAFSTLAVGFGKAVQSRPLHPHAARHSADL